MQSPVVYEARQGEVRAGPRKDLKFLIAGEMAGRSTAMRAEAAEEIRPDHDASASLFQSSHFILRAHCMVFSKGGTRSD